MTAFDVALGRAAVRDGELVIERTDPERAGRWALVRANVRQQLEHRPVGFGVTMALMVGLVVAFVGALASVYRQTPAAAPLVIGLALGGVAVVSTAFEASYRRGMRQRQAFREALSEEYDLVSVERLELSAVTGVTQRRFELWVPRVAGTHLLVHHDRDGEPATLTLGFPDFMETELETARGVFERRGIPVDADAEATEGREA